jgi:glycosyltransferase involved in cell wall biosynthesis
MKKVNFLIGKLSSGGAERVVSNLSLNMDKQIEKNIILFGENQQIIYDYSGQIISLDKSNSRKLKNKIITLLNRVKDIRKIIRESQAPMISFLEYSNILNLLTKSSGKTIISVRNHMTKKHSKGIKSFFWRCTIKYLYKYADELIVESKEIKNDLIVNYKIPSEKINLIYNSYPIEDIKEKSLKNYHFNKLKFDTNQKFIWTVGRLNTQKGHKYLIDVFSLGLNQNPDVKLVVVAVGPLKAELVGQCERLEIVDAVYFVDFIDNPFEIVSSARAFVLSSRFEGFPNALLEAMVCETPVIATDCPSRPKEILGEGKHNHGFLIGNLDSQNIEETKKDLYEKITLLLNDNIIYEDYKNRAIARSNDFNIKKIIKQWEKLI